jgi:hypothetical protein
MADEQQAPRPDEGKEQALPPHLPRRPRETRFSRLLSFDQVEVPSVAETDRSDTPLPLRQADLETSGPSTPPLEAGPAPPQFTELPVEQHASIMTGEIAVTAQMSGPHVQRVQSVSDAFEGPPTVASDSGLPFETNTESIANPPRKVSGAAAALSGEGGLAAEATIRPGRVTIVPTPYPADPTAPLVVSGYVRIDVQSAEFAELSAKLDDVIHLLGRSNQFAGETRDQLVAEIQAGRRLLNAPKPDRTLIETLLISPLTYIAAAASVGIIGEYANEAVRLLLRMLETNIPL